MLHGVDLELEAGIDVAVVGETGSGKTTFAKLLCRLADPTEGTIELNGVDLRDLAPRGPPRDGPHGAPGRLPLRRDGPRERHDGPSRRHDRRRRRGVRPPRPRLVGRAACPTASTPRSASGARTSRSASASSCPWPGRSWPTRVCSSSTRPPRRSIPRRSGRSPPRSPGWPRDARRSASPTGCRPPRRADLVLVFDQGQIVERGTPRRARRRRRSLRVAVRELAGQHPSSSRPSTLGLPAAPVPVMRTGPPAMVVGQRQGPTTSFLWKGPQEIRPVASASPGDSP